MVEYFYIGDSDCDAEPYNSEYTETSKGPECPYVCDPGYTELECITPLERLLGPFFGTPTGLSVSACLFLAAKCSIV